MRTRDIKLLLTIFSVITFCHAYGQSSFQQLLKYKYVFYPDSTDKNFRSENMFLLVNAETSYFMSASNYYLDSIKNTNSYKNSGDAAQLAALSTYPTHNNLYIETNSFTNAITHTEHTKVQTLSKVQYVETISPAWKLETERKTINGIPCQKASCTLFGGTWTAWYSTSIPLPFGPYKFHGLPGLIVQLENSNKTHVFTLYAHQNIDRKFPLTSFEPLQKTDKQHAVNLVNKGKYTTASFDGVTVVDDPTFVSRLQKKLDERRKR